MNEPKLLDLGVQAAAGGGSFALTLYAIRWALNWLTGRVDRREALVQAQEEKVDREWQAIREALEGRIEKLEAQVDKVTRESEAYRLAFHHVAKALVAADPNHPALTIADQILSVAFPLDLRTLAERADLALDRAAAAKPAE
ncbi:hypothetical protein LZK98_11605 [Sphingomonas cannabina]|uniref:hypothetical protein n=1 Tax=Sphingomonas cannabina TaxID=2899123 RepID=UPI001F34AE48|nr:hypothetical protein [Sphingomonas cannabina]UIJ43736.1 hypothetical protein LZK98_11605 [Sphingomonas cannabina]